MIILIIRFSKWGLELPDQQITEESDTSRDMTYRSKYNSSVHVITNIKPKSRTLTTSSNWTITLIKTLTVDTNPIILNPKL